MSIIIERTCLQQAYALILWISGKEPEGNSV